MISQSVIHWSGVLPCAQQRYLGLSIPLFDSPNVAKGGRRNADFLEHEYSEELGLRLHSGSRCGVGCVPRAVT